MEDAATRDLVMRYFGAWQQGDPAALRACLADEVHLDWGAAVYADPDEFVAASDAGITWTDVDLIEAEFGPGRARLLYEATNRGDRVRLRTEEELVIRGGRIARATVRFETVSPD